MKINYTEFMAIAHNAHAWDIIECWDRMAFNTYIKEFGPMTKSQAESICHFTKEVSEDEIAAADYFGRG